MKLRTSVTVGVCGLVVVGLVALAVPAVGAVGDFVHSVATAAAAARASDPADGDLGAGIPHPVRGPDGCDSLTLFVVSTNDEGEAHAHVLGDLVDTGATYGAGGEVIRDAHGIHAYVATTGDDLASIGDRFCLLFPDTRQAADMQGDVRPDRVLVLRPDPNEAWIPFWQATED
ncbi:hypothetical protein [Microbacterium gorillae]|uniref:hypothetical protein n=1 Tax=Microbacterium gorillae TaxID=1231063 RepID=UPI00058F0D5B|nr:hypothetical protein [Microbacterium gorillae]